MKHKKMKDFTSIKSDDFESKAVDIVDGDNIGYPIAGNPIIIENFVVDKNSVATQIANDAITKHEPAKTEAKTGGHCFGDKMKDFTLIKSDDFEGKVVDIVDGDNTGWFYDVPFQHFGEQDTTILELDNSNDLSQYFTNSDDFLILELDDIIDCGGKATTPRFTLDEATTPETTTPETTTPETTTPEVTTPESTPKTTPGCTSETTSKTTVEVTLEVTLEGGTLNVGITVEAALEVASRVQTWFWGAQDSIDLPVM